jgi:hypothetical protein
MCVIMHMCMMWMYKAAFLSRDFFTSIGGTHSTSTAHLEWLATAAAVHRVEALLPAAIAVHVHAQ